MSTLLKKKVFIEFWEGIQALQIISTYFPKSLLFFLQCFHFLDIQAQSLKCSEYNLQDLLEIVFLNIDQTGFQCRMSSYNNYTGFPQY